MSFRIGDLVQTNLQGIELGMGIVFSTDDSNAAGDEPLISVISLCSKKVFSVPAKDVRLENSNIGCDTMTPDLHYCNGDIVNFVSCGKVLVGLVQLFRNGIYTIARNDSNQDGTVFANGNLVVNVSEENVLQTSSAVVQTLFRARWNDAILKAVSEKRKNAQELREKAKQLFEQSIDMRYEADQLADKAEDAKDEADQCIKCGDRLMEEMI